MFVGTLAVKIHGPDGPGARGVDAISHRRDLVLSSLDCLFFSLMVGCGESYIAAYVLESGHGALAAGLVVSVPLFCGALLQLCSPWGVVSLGTERRWVVLLSFFQSVSMLFLAVGAASGHHSLVWVFFWTSIYWACNLGAGPAWNTWMQSLVPRRVRHRYFARRSCIAAVAVVVSLLSGGFALRAQAGTGRSIHTFVALFACASLFRFLSCLCLWLQSEGRGSSRPKFVTPMSLLSRMSSSVPNDLHILKYILAFQFSVYLTVPFFTPFMLQFLGLSYLQFVTLIATAFAAKIVALPLIGELLKRLGTLKFLWLASISITPLSALWTLNHQFLYLVLLQVVAGVAWGAFELVSFLITVEVIPEEERTGILTAFTFLNSTAQLVGAALGSILLR